MEVAADMWNHFPGMLKKFEKEGREFPDFTEDETGRVTHHIDAPPGLNLRRYLNQRVGIIGSRGFHQQLQLNHVTAERIIALNTLRR
jgi:hypothetical protein